MVGVKVFFNGLNRADEFIQELFGGLSISLVADERLVVGIYRFCLASDSGNQFHQAISHRRMFTSKRVNKVTQGLATCHDPLFKAGDFLVFCRELRIT